MMDAHTKSSYEIKTSKTGHPVPVVNGIHLHSIYNPLKEAETLIEKKISAIKLNKKILILGLGFGYHLNRLILTLNNIHGTDYKVIVIEPNTVMYKDYREKINPEFNDNVKIYSGSSVDDIYQYSEFVDFLLSKPVVIAHPASYNLEERYFKALLTYTAPQSLDNTIYKTKYSVIADFLKKFPQDFSINECANKTELSSNVEENDFILMALGAMSNKPKSEEPANV